MRLNLQHILLLVAGNIVSTKKETIRLPLLIEMLHSSPAKAMRIGRRMTSKEKVTDRYRSNRVHTYIHTLLITVFYVVPLEISHCARYARSKLVMAHLYKQTLLLWLSVIHWLIISHRQKSQIEVRRILSSCLERENACTRSNWISNLNTHTWWKEKPTYIWQAPNILRG